MTFQFMLGYLLSTSISVSLGVVVGICMANSGGKEAKNDEDDVANALEGALIPFVSDLNRTKV